VQEQHADRARLYKQWRKLDWPIFVDSLNVLGHRVVPIPMLVDPNGRVFAGGRWGRQEFEQFLATSFPKEKLARPGSPLASDGDADFYAGRYGKAIAAYEGAPFKRGVALRARFESQQRRPGDGQAAVDAWSRALAGSPNNYIWRRRLQQYGPRLAKPYNFYSWIEQARREIRARDEEPVPLREEPRGAELIDRQGGSNGKPVDADPEGKINRDADDLVTLATIATPAPVLPGHRVRVRLVFRPGKGLWNNESGEMTLFVEPGSGLVLKEGTFAHPPAKTPESNETRYLEFELEVAAGAPQAAKVTGYALYYVCEKKGGVCTYLRRDFTIPIRVDKQAARIQ